MVSLSTSKRILFKGGDLEDTSKEIFIGKCTKLFAFTNTGCNGKWFRLSSGCHTLSRVDAAY